MIRAPLSNALITRVVKVNDRLIRIFYFADSGGAASAIHYRDMCHAMRSAQVGRVWCTRTREALSNLSST